MTFGICLFILLLQFLWKYVEDLVGKGLDTLVLLELFFYAALNLIPMALPLALLLASLMTFGNMGERLELLAIKASGISLLRVMKPLIIFVAALSIGAFFFQNEAMPRINVKFKSLLASIKYKSPEMDIPEGAFYSGVPNYSIYVNKKDPETKILHNVMIYDTSNGFNNMSVFVCDSALMRVAESKDFLLLNLYSGERFANFQGGSMSYTPTTKSNFVPYSRENFKEKDIIIRFNTDFKRIDESNYENNQVGKNITELSQSIDSMKKQVDSMNITDKANLKYIFLSYKSDSIYIKDKLENKIDANEVINFDSLMSSFNDNDLLRIYESTSSDAESKGYSFTNSALFKADTEKKIRYHQVEWHQKYTLSFACLIFFFIGAPLGAIIRKGGLGLPVVVSVLLFIIYYIINNIGVKMARDGVWEAWQGMWLSSFILFPLGVFLTYKAMNDSAIFNFDTYNRYIRKILRINTKLEYDISENVNINSVPDLDSLQANPALLNNLEPLDNNGLKDIAWNYEEYGYKKDILPVVLSLLKKRGDSFFDVKVKNVNWEDAKACYSSFEKSSRYTTISYVVTIIIAIYMIISYAINLSNKGISLITIPYFILIVTSIVYIISYIKSMIFYSDFFKIIDYKPKQNRLKNVMSFICYPARLKSLKKQMKNRIDME